MHIEAVSVKLQLSCSDSSLSGVSHLTSCKVVGQVARVVLNLFQKDVFAL